ncbi:Type II iodothyronine deiodinase [Fukomys damarensis]|uniref:Iodothyronine deiodinase n=1 Tax=Fukomys damarensis TaxID=885580 RepID=A0A091CX00_FUKDA|nr:Type II iodothyronine deiodinase [Fukomys damarensis]
MGILSIDLLITLQILPVFFSNCLFLALYDSVILLKHVVLLLSRSKSTRGEWRRMLTSEGLRCVWKSFLLDAYKQVKLGEDAPNSSVVCVSSPEGGHSCGNGVREKTADGVLQLPAFSKLVEEFSSVADFLLVYIDEAHPSDGWAVPGGSSLSLEVKKHRNQEDRCAAAHQLLERFSLPPQCQVVADCMDNNANVAYGVAFERVCIVQRQKIAYLGGKGPFCYNLQEVRHWLEKNFSKR